MAARPHIYIVGFSLVDQPVTIKIETATQELGLTSKASPGFCELKQKRTRLRSVKVLAVFTKRTKKQALPVLIES